jgi:hypothetical protein
VLQSISCRPTTGTAWALAGFRELLAPQGETKKLQGWDQAPGQKIAILLDMPDRALCAPVEFAKVTLPERVFNPKFEPRVQPQSLCVPEYY